MHLLGDQREEGRDARPPPRHANRRFGEWTAVGRGDAEKEGVERHNAEGNQPITDNAEGNYFALFFARITTDNSSFRTFVNRSLTRPSASSEMMAGVFTDVSVHPAGSVTS